MTDVGREEEKDRRLDDVDDLHRDAGLDLHEPGARAHGAEQERGEHDPDRMRRPSRATVIASNPTVVPYDAFMKWLMTEDLAGAG